MSTRKSKKAESVDDLMEKDGFISRGEAARRSMMSRATIYSWVKRGKLASKRVGLGKVYVSLADLQKLCPYVPS